MKNENNIENDIVSEEIFNLSNNQLEKLEKIRKLFMIPLLVWSVIILIDFIFFVVEIDTLFELRKWIGKIAFYSFPLFLLYLVFATFYSSYRILESRGYKNIAAFLFFQMLAYFIIEVLRLEIPEFNRTMSIILTASMCLAIFFIITLVQFRLKLPEKHSIFNKKLNISLKSKTFGDEQPNEAMGMIVSSLFSIVIASIIYFRVRSGISFVTWGTFFGIALSAMIHKADKSILSILYFLDPRGAINLFKILRLKADVEDEEDLSKVEKELTSLTKAQMKTQALRLANELDQELHRVQFEEGKRKISILIDKLRNSDQRPPGEQKEILDEVTDVIQRLRIDKKIPGILPEPDYSELSLGEKITQQIGLTDKEIDQAIKEDLIDPEQRYLWTERNQRRIKSASLDFDKEKYQGMPPVYIAESWVSFFESNKHLLERIVTNLSQSDENIYLKSIKGDNFDLSELVFTTAVKEYSAVIRQGSDHSYLIFGVFDRILKKIKR